MLASLPERFRRVVLLFDVEGFTYREIARILGVPIGTLRPGCIVAERRSGSGCGYESALRAAGIAIGAASKPTWCWPAGKADPPPQRPLSISWQECVWLCRTALARL